MVLTMVGGSDKGSFERSEVEDERGQGKRKERLELRNSRIEERIVSSSSSLFFLKMVSCVEETILIYEEVKSQLFFKVIDWLVFNFKKPTSTLPYLPTTTNGGSFGWISFQGSFENLLLPSRS